MKLVLLVLVALVAVLLGGVVVQDSAPSTPDDFRPTPLDAQQQKVVTRTYTRTVERVRINGDKYEAWFYMPTNTTEAKPPVIIMANGMGAQKDFGLESYAKRFVEEGWAVLLFDYRSFGNSEGQPRNFISPTRHIEDYHAAVVHLANSDHLCNLIDVTRIALWGVSYSGGHVLVTASEWETVTKSFPINYILDQRPESPNRTLPRLKAVYAQVPHLDPHAVLPTLNLQLMARGFALAIADWFGSWFGLSVYVKIYGSTNEVAILNTAESLEYGQLVPQTPLGGWVNKAPARSILSIPFYRPLDYVGSIESPILIVAATKDSLCPISAVNEAEKLLKNGKVIRLDCGHFEMFEGRPYFNEALEHQIRFFREHL